MTDHDNADNADGQNSKLSRRTALGLMGASAVGGAAASSAYSELTADRPIDVEVTDDDPDTVTEATDSTLEISNNSDETIEAEISIDEDDADYADLSVDGVTNATVSGAGPWDLTELSDGETAEIEFVHSDEETNVTFDVEAFSDTDGFSILSSQLVTVAESKIPTSGLVYNFDAQTESYETGSIDTISERVADNDATGDVDFTTSGINGNPSYEFPDDEEFAEADAAPVGSGDEYTAAAVFEGTEDGGYLFRSGSRYAFQLEFDDDDDDQYNLVHESEENNRAGTPDTDPHIMVVSYDGSTLVVEVDGEEIIDNDLGLDSGTDNLRIGARRSSSFYHGLIGQLRFYDEHYDETEREELYEALQDRWDFEQDEDDPEVSSTGLVHQYDGRDDDTLVQSNGAVDEWEDATSSTDLTTGTANGLSTINDVQAVEFSEDELVAEEEAPSLDGEYTLWAVLDPATFDGDRRNPFYVSEGSSGVRLSVGEEDGENEIAVTNSGETGLNEMTVDSTPFVFGVRYSDSEGWETRLITESADDTETGDDTGFADPEGDDMGVGQHEGQDDADYDGLAGQYLLYDQRQADDDWDQNASALSDIWL